LQGQEDRSAERRKSAFKVTEQRDLAIFGDGFDAPFPTDRDCGEDRASTDRRVETV